MGRPERMAAAAKSPQRNWCSWTKSLAPTARVSWSCWVSSTEATGYSITAPMKDSRKTTARIGPAMGSSTRRKATQVLAPSTRAASSISAGRVS